MRKIVDFSAKAFSLMELMIVGVIVGILATIAIMQFSGPVEQSLEKEAKANLKLIAAAEKIYRMEIGSYVGATNETDINARLRLMLPANSASKNWNYTVDSSDPTTFSAIATRTKGTPPKTYTIDQVAEDPY